jgi:hypothetical protein
MNKARFVAVAITCELADQIGRIAVPKPAPPGPAPPRLRPRSPQSLASSAE